MLFLLHGKIRVIKTTKIYFVIKYNLYFFKKKKKEKRDFMVILVPVQSIMGYRFAFQDRQIVP